MHMKATLLLALAGACVSAEEVWGPQVMFVGDEDFAAFQEKNPKFLAMFFAPWCGHCKAMKPAFSEAAESLQFRVPLVAVDCTEDGKATCSEFDVSGFPTLKWFGGEGGEGPEEYSAGRSADELVKFVTEKVGDEPEDFEGVDFSKFKIRQLKKLLFDRGQDCAGCAEKRDFVKKVEATIHLPKTGPKKKAKKKFKGTSLKNGRTVAQERRWKEAKKVADEGWEDNGAVVHLIEDDFETFRKEKGANGMFTMFYAPWCGHCNNLKPAIAEASTTLKDDIPMTAIDCVTNPDVCFRYGAKSYPTLIFFPDAEPKSKIAYDGARSAKGFVNYLRKKMNPDYEVVLEPFKNKAVWDENGAVVHMTEEHWDSYRKENPKMFVIFYAPWCGHCKAAKPAWAAASTQVEGKMPFLAVDCDGEGSGVCQKHGVTGYPTIKYFDSSESEGEDYFGGRSEEDFVAFAESKAGDSDGKTGHAEL